MFRRIKLEKAVRDVTEKATWLAKNRAGTRYDIGAYRRIVSVVVTPRTEYIWSESPSLWITKTLPRIMDRHEFSDACKDGVFGSISDDHPAVTLIR